MQWKTGITRVVPNDIRVRGYAIADLIHHLSFGEAAYLVLMGTPPSSQHARALNAVLVATIDHSVTAPSACATRFAASGGSPMQAAVAAGLLALGDHHGGAIEQAQALLEDGVTRAERESNSLESIAETILQEYKSQGRRLPGFGHPYHAPDPRTTALFQLAEDEGLAGPHVQFAKALEAASEKMLGRHVVINTDAAQAALLAEMKIPRHFARGIFLISRCAGLVAHAAEEYTQERPFRAVAHTDVDYTGPAPRSLP